MKYLFLFISSIAMAQSIENANNLKDIKRKLQENKQIIQITLIGDSHIQTGYLPNLLRKNFQNKYGNAGRGVVFPYQIANSNAPEDIESYSNQTWTTFRNSYPQNLYNDMGIGGYIMANNKESFIEIQLKNDFNEVKIFSNPTFSERELLIYHNPHSLKNFTTKRFEILPYILQNETYAELAAKFYTTTTRLKQLNGNSIMSPQSGRAVKVENTRIYFNKNFENSLQLLGKTSLNKGIATFSYPHPRHTFLMKTDGKGENQFYGFQFLKNVDKGVVFNSIGANGATYKDFLKYPLQVQQINSLNNDLVIIDLGTNESLSKIGKEEFQNNISQTISKLRENNSELSILLISPTTNKISAQKIPQIVSWIEESAQKNHTAFLNMYRLTGENYFLKSLKENKANKDGVHFLQKGYEEQANIIWNALMEVLRD